MHSSQPLDLTREPLATSLLTAEQRERLTDLLDRYLASLESGVPIDPEVLIDQHPDLSEQLREYLHSLHDLHRAAMGFADGSEIGTATRCEDDTKRLGDFLIGRELGRGGMGVVYEARQISLDRQVALKVLPFAAVLDAQQIARFRTEAQAAAQILHPNIVPVFAIGVERGVHFYAMQLIVGQPLDRAIAELRASRRVLYRSIQHTQAETRGDDASVIPGDLVLPEPARVEDEQCGGSLLSSHGHASRDYFDTVARLGIQAAEALHAAHEHGVVHRDVKPSNLLLDRDGKLWVTDFGLARCRSNASFSRSGDVVGTMRYMSPEQASGQTSLIDHRTDVYSLGVTLYELLTLRQAIAGEDGPALLRKLGSAEPTPPRKLNAKIPAALENVILKAIARSRDDRYPTALELAEDLRRFLDGRPTVAKPPSVIEHGLRWAARHRRLVAATVAIMLAACLGLTVSTLLIAREKLRTERNYERAERNLDEAREAVERFGSQFAERLAGVPGAARVRQDMLRQTRDAYLRFAEQAADDPALRSDLALTYSKIGSINEKMGSTEEAMAAHDTAIDLFKKLVAAEPRQLEHRRRLALCQNNLALTLQRAGQVAEARQQFEDAIDLQTALVRQRTDDSLLSDLAVTHTNLGLLLSETGAKSEAERSFREAIRLQERLVEAAPQDARRLHGLANSYNNLSAVYVGRDAEQAEQSYRVAIESLKQALAFQPDDPAIAASLASTYSNLGSLQSSRNRHDAAAIAFEEAIELQQALVDVARYDNGYRRDLAITYNNYGLALSRTRRSQVAEKVFRQALEIHHTLAALDPNDLVLRSSLGSVYNNLGIVLEEQERFEDAATAYGDAIAQQKQAFRGAPAVTRYRLFLSKHYFNLGRVLRELGQGDQAVEAALQRRALWPGEPERLLSVAEELASATACVTDRDGLVTRVTETLDQALAAGGDIPSDLAGRTAFALLSEDERLSSWFARRAPGTSSRLDHDRRDNEQHDG